MKLEQLSRRQARICRQAYYSLSTKGQMVGTAELAQTRNFSVELLWKADRFELGEITEEDFVEVYPMLPGHIDLLMQITSNLRTRSTRVQGDDHAIRGLLQLLGDLVVDRQGALGIALSLDQPRLQELRLQHLRPVQRQLGPRIGIDPGWLTSPMTYTIAGLASTTITVTTGLVTYSLRDVVI